MKPCLAFFTTFLVLTSALAADPFIKIGDLKLYRAYAPKDSEVGLREYLPAGENFDRWNRLASVRIFKDIRDPEAYLSAVAEAVTKSHPAARYQFLQNDKTKEVVLDFMTFPPKSAPVHFAEWNLMRAKYVKGTGLLVYQYAMRFYNFDESTAAIVNAERKKMIRPFGEATFEELK